MITSLDRAKQLITLKSLEDAPNYRKVGDASLQRCGTCRHFTDSGRCDLYDFKADPLYTCDSWRPSIERLKLAREATETVKEVSPTPTATYAHGPGGLLSPAGLGGGKRKAAETPMKSEGDGKHPASHYLVVEDADSPSTWHLRVRNTAGELDRRLMGAAWAALTVGYRGNRYAGPNKREALVKLRALYRQIEATPPGETEKAVTTKPGDKYRSLKRPDIYEKLLAKGYSKAQAAAISNAMAGRRKRAKTKELSPLEYAYALVATKHVSHDQKAHGARHGVGGLREFAKKRGYSIRDRGEGAKHGRYEIRGGKSGKANMRADNLTSAKMLMRKDNKRNIKSDRKLAKLRHGGFKKGQIVMPKQGDKYGTNRSFRGRIIRFEGDYIILRPLNARPGSFADNEFFIPISDAMPASEKEWHTETRSTTATDRLQKARELAGRADSTTATGAAVSTTKQTAGTPATSTALKHATHNQASHGFRFGSTPSLAQARRYRKAGVLPEYSKRARERSGTKPAKERNAEKPKKPKEQVYKRGDTIEVTSRYGMLLPGMRAKVISYWKDPYGVGRVRVDSGANQSGQRLRNIIPTNSIKLVEANKEQKTQTPTFTVFKDKTGKYRWVAISSTAYRDRDGEIVSTKALADDVARADETGQYGPLRWWHVPGLDLGDTDFNMLHGRTLIESGTFKNDRIAEKVKENARNLRLSLGFRHPANEPDKAGVFHNIRRFERSLIPPEGNASNLFTSLNVF